MPEPLGRLWVWATAVLVGVVVLEDTTIEDPPPPHQPPPPFGIIILFEFPVDVPPVPVIPVPVLHVPDIGEPTSLISSIQTKSLLSPRFSRIRRANSGASAASAGSDR